MKNRILLLCLLAAALMALTATGAGASDVAIKTGTTGSLTWTLNTNTGVMTISGNGAMADYSYHAKEDKYDESSVNTPWFDFRSGIKTVIAQSGVTHIGANAFNMCYYITSVNLPSTVSSIGVSAFDGARLTTLALPDGLTQIGNAAFFHSQLTDLTLPSTITTIGSSAFYHSQLTTLDLPSALTSIGANAFFNSPLTALNLPDGLTYIGDSAFQHALLAELALPDGITYLGKKAFYDSPLESVLLPESITTYPDAAFNPSTQLLPTTQPHGEIGDLTWDIYGSTLTIRGNGPMPDFQLVYAANEGNYYPDTPWYPLAFRVETVVIKQGVTAIGQSAFQGMSSVKSVTIPSTVTSIGSYAFLGCASLNSLRVPTSVTFLGQHPYDNNTTISGLLACGAAGNLSWKIVDGELSFSGTGDIPDYPMHRRVDRYDLGDYAETPWQSYRGSITSIVIQYGVTRIGTNAFYSSYNAADVTIPSSVTSIGSDAFAKCYAIGRVNYDEVANKWSSITFENAYANPMAESGKAYLYCQSVYNSYSYIELMSSVYYNADSESIKPYAFYNCKNDFYAVSNGGYKADIGAYAFYNCTGLTRADFTHEIRSVGDYAFFNCSSMTRTYHLFSNLEQLGANAFYKCSGLTSVTMNKISVIPAWAFYECTGLQEIVIPASVTSIGSYAFSGCSNLTNVVFRGKGPEISDYAFYGVDSLNASYRSGPSWEGKLRNYGSQITWTPTGGTADYSNVSWQLTDENVLILTGSGRFSPYGCCDEIVQNDIYFADVGEGVTSLGLEYSSNIKGIRFRGDVPIVTLPASASVDAYYFENRPAWTAEARQAMGENIIWHPVCSAFEGEGMNHSIAFVDTLPASCTEDGVAAYYQCTVCGLCFEDEEGTAALLNGPQALPALGHNYGAPEFRWTENGSACTLVFTCANFGDQASVAAEVTSVQTAQPDCVNAGQTTYTASAVFLNQPYTDTLVLDDLPALGHTPVTVEGFAATCTEAGLSDEIFCSVCNATLQAGEEIPPLGHTDEITLEAVAPTCTLPGRTAEHTCKICGVRLEESTVLPATGHHYGAPVFTWTEDGSACSAAFICERQDDTQTLPAPVSENITLPPTCTELGSAEYTAVVTFLEKEYSDTYVRNDLPALGHSPVEDPAVPPTDRQAGLTAGSHCAVCQAVLAEQQVIPALWSYTEDGMTVTAYHGEETELTIPEGVTALGDTLFKNDALVTIVHIPDAVTMIGAQTFYGASALTDVWLPDNLDGIGVQTFYNTTARLHTGIESATARSLSLRGKNFTNGDWTLRYRVTSLTVAPTAVYLAGWAGEAEELVLPESFGGAPLTQILTKAFANRGQLRRVAIPGTVTSIADDAFAGCGESLVIVSPCTAHAKTWAEGTGFAWEHDLGAVTVLPAVEATCTETGLTEGLICTECGALLKAQEEVPSLGHDWNETTYTWAEDKATLTACRTCKRNETHIESETVSVIRSLIKAPTDEDPGEYVLIADGFQNPAFTKQEKSGGTIPALKELSTLYLPAGLLSIEEEAFSGLDCEAIILPDGCTTIGEKAFADCTKLIYVYLPSSITTISSDAFEGCVSAFLDKHP